jgi:hypothetical protein
MLRRMWAWAALLLAIILAHALLPIASPTVKTSGSPFSASTLEVSTAPTRKAPVAGERQAIKDPDIGLDMAPAFAVVENVSPRSTRIERSPARGPPPAALSPAYPSGASLSRAPPLS